MTYEITRRRLTETPFPFIGRSVAMDAIGAIGEALGEMPPAATAEGS